MMRRFVIATIMIALSTLSTGAFSYDAKLAASYQRLFSPAAGAQAGKALHLITPQALVQKINAGAPMILLDVRTPAETGIFSVTLPGSLAIPLNELFTAESLARIPMDKTVVVLCKSGIRAAAAGTALRHIGFGKVLILKGGFKGLSDYLDAKTANAPTKPGKTN